MIIGIEDNTSVEYFDVCTTSIDDIVYEQKVSFNKTLDGQNFAYNYGNLYDKWSFEVTIEEFESDLVDLLIKLGGSLRQATVQVNESELVCGPGIDYDDKLVCNITIIPIASNIVNFAFSKMSLRFEVLYLDKASAVEQVSYKSEVPSTLPTTLGYKYGISRSLNRNSVSYRSDIFGAYGVCDLRKGTGTVNDSSCVVTIMANEFNSAAIGKFYSVQRTTPFIWPDVTAPFFFNNQGSGNVIIKSFNQKLVNFKYWETSLTLVNNAI